VPGPDDGARIISTALVTTYRTAHLPHKHTLILPTAFTLIMALDSFFHNKIESMKLEIIQGQAVLRRLEAQRNDYNSRGIDGAYPSPSSPSLHSLVRLLREELGLLQQPGSYVGEVVKVMGTKKVLVKVHPEGKYGTKCRQFS
jgi:26S proteasome regulatory subunit T6